MPDDPPQNPEPPPEPQPDPPRPALPDVARLLEWTADCQRTARTQPDRAEEMHRAVEQQATEWARWIREAPAA